jgi:hypothetical protein
LEGVVDWKILPGGGRLGVNHQKNYASRCPELRTWLVS